MKLKLKILSSILLCFSILSCKNATTCSRLYSGLFNSDYNIQMTYSGSSKQLNLQGSIANLNKDFILVKVLNKSGQIQSYTVPMQNGFISYSIMDVNSTDQICIDSHCGNSFDFGTVQPIYTSICM